MTLASDFEKAVVDVKKLRTTPSDDDLLSLYGYFKQVREGDCDTPRPGLFAVKEKAKWNAWNELKGTSKDTAMQCYIDLVDDLRHR